MYRYAIVLLMMWLTSGCTEQRELATRLDALRAIARAMCSRAERCGSHAPGDLDRCIDQFVAEECYRHGCDREPAAPDAAIYACIAAINTMTCAEPSWPAACRGLP